ncbi:XRE family transcriptional regulator [Halodesulfovibrio sp.]|jgi:hypothetical protein|uniref:XRE family transcriptional regulator n=1 Tax=Halodesulfovibrio sp. TaxID=1912772 RepID=UPI0025D3038F|nr:XRE family transcriptional regulator [Halodesulfovibrio sp.]MCT4533775.1 XRE family transcriptional regulator [Halodesulfovibrio sp.]
MPHKEILTNRAELQSDNPATQHDDLSGCENCSEEVIFAMEDSFHQFSIGLRTILQCLDLAEIKGSIPPLPDEWWNEVANRHNFFPMQRE